MKRLYSDIRGDDFNIGDFNIGDFNIGDFNIGVEIETCCDDTDLQLERFEWVDDGSVKCGGDHARKEFRTHRNYTFKGLTAPEIDFVDLEIIREHCQGCIENSCGTHVHISKRGVFVDDSPMFGEYFLKNWLRMGGKELIDKYGLRKNNDYCAISTNPNPNTDLLKKYLMINTYNSFFEGLLWHLEIRGLGDFLHLNFDAKKLFDYCVDVMSLFNTVYEEFKLEYDGYPLQKQWDDALPTLLDSFNSHNSDQTLECDFFEFLLKNCKNLRNSLKGNVHNALLLVATCPLLLEDLINYGIFQETDPHFHFVITAATDNHSYEQYKEEYEEVFDDEEIQLLKFDSPKTRADKMYQRIIISSPKTLRADSRGKNAKKCE